MVKEFLLLLQRTQVFQDSMKGTSPLSATLVLENPTCSLVFTGSHMHVCLQTLSHTHTHTHIYSSKKKSLKVYLIGSLHDSTVEVCSQGILKTSQSCEPQAWMNVRVPSVFKCLGLQEEGWALLSWFDTQSLRPQPRPEQTASPFQPDSQEGVHAHLRCSSMELYLLHMAWFPWVQEIIASGEVTNFS